MTGEDEGSVKYSFKELIERLERKLDTVLDALGGKADTGRVEALEGRVDGVERKLTEVAHREAVDREQKRSHTEWRQLAINTGVGLLLVAATVGLMLATMH